MQLGGTINDKKKTGRSTSWTPARENQLFYINKFLEKLLLPFQNPPNVRNARPIENFWVCLTQKVYEGKWKTKTEHQLIRCIESMMKEIVKKLAESLLEKIKAKVRSIRSR